MYATVAKGYRIGGANPAIGEFCDLTPYGLKGVPPQYGADNVWSYELGTKNTFDDRRVLLNASVYYIKWNSIQQNVELPCGFQFTDNLGAAASRGFDLQTEYKVSDALTVGGTFGYTNASYTQTVFATQVAAQTPGSFSIVQDGDHLSGAPWTVGAVQSGEFPSVFDQWVRARRLPVQRQADRHHRASEPAQRRERRGRAEYSVDLIRDAADRRQMGGL